MLLLQDEVTAFSSQCFLTCAIKYVKQKTMYETPL